MPVRHQKVLELIEVVTQQIEEGPAPDKFTPNKGNQLPHSAAEVHVQPDAGFRLSGLPNPKCPCTHIVSYSRYIEYIGHKVYTIWAHGC